MDALTHHTLAAKRRPGWTSVFVTQELRKMLEEKLEDILQVLEKLNFESDSIKKNIYQDTLITVRFLLDCKKNEALLKKKDKGLLYLIAMGVDIEALMV